MKIPELQNRLTANHTSFTGFIGNLSDILVNHSMPGKWTPIQQLSHIEKSVSPVKLAFSLPKFVLSFLFGKTKRASRSYDELVTDYKQKLTGGGKTTPRYLPAPSCDRQDLHKAVDNHIKVLCAKIERFTETELDQFTLPHPLLGKLTLREMIYFTIHHVEHHHSQINPALRAAVA